jgi:Uma2 family endonuclease
VIQRLAPLTVAQYEALVADGEFDQWDDRVELIRGELHVMSPASTLHDDLLSYLLAWSFASCARQGLQVRSQQGLNLADCQSVPEPDIAWVPQRRYKTARPASRDVALVIEVALSSLAYDRDVKGRLYAEAGIAEYWIVNGEEQCVEVYRSPQDGAYREQFAVSGAEKVSPLAAPDAWLDVADLFLGETNSA